MLLWHKPITLIGAMWCNLYNVPHIHRPFDTRFTNLRRHHANQDNWLEIYCFAGYCLSFIDLRLLSTPMRSVVRYHTSFPYSWLTTGCFTIVIWWVPLMGRVQLYCSENITVMNSICSILGCICKDHCPVGLLFLGHCIVCPYSIYVSDYFFGIFKLYLNLNIVMDT